MGGVGVGAARAGRRRSRPVVRAVAALGRGGERDVAAVGRGRDAPGEDATRLETELGYGFGVPGSGLLTLWGGFGFDQGAARRYRLGTRLDLGGAIDLGLEAQRKEGAADPEHGLRLDLRIGW